MRSVAIFVAVFLGAAGVARAGTINVTSFTDSNAGTPPGTGAGSAGDLRAAVIASAAGDTINFTCATSPCTITLNGPLPLIGHNLTIDGGTAGRIIIDGNGLYRAFWVETGTVTLKNLFVRNVLAQGGSSPAGFAGGGGGAGLGAGVFVDQASAAVTLSNVVFISAAAAGGNGGISTGFDGAIAVSGGGGLGGSGAAGLNEGNGGGGGGILGAGSGSTGGVGWTTSLGTGGNGGSFTAGNGQFGGGGGGALAGGAVSGNGGFGGGAGGSGGGSAIAGSAGGGGGGGGGIGGGAMASSGGALSAAVYGGNGDTGGNGGGGAAAGPAVFVYAGSVTTSSVYVAGASATPGTGGSATADATPVFNYGGTVNASTTTGPIASATTAVFPVASLSAGTVGVAYSQAVAPAAFGTGATTVTGTALPAGLSVSSGNLAGTPTAAGTFHVLLTATDGAGTTVSQSFPVTINKGTQTISFMPQVTPTFSDGSFPVSATATSGLTVTFASTTTSVCTVSGTTVTIVAPGTCTIVASQAGDANWNAAANVNQDIDIGKGTQTINFANPGNQSFSSGATFDVSATATSGLAVSFTSATPSVCTVAGATVSILTGGTCTIHADQAGDANYNAAPTISTDITIGLADQTITFPDPGAQTFSSDGTFMVSATASSGLTVTFTSQTPTVCTVAATTVTMLTPGTCTIAADQAGNDDYGTAATVTQSITIGKDSQTITFTSPGDQSLQTGNVSITATASSGLAVTITSTTPSICTVANGVVTFVAAGTCTLDAAQPGNDAFSAATDVTVSFAIGKTQATVSLTAAPTTAKSNELTTLTASVSGSAATGTVDFTDGSTTLCAAVSLSNGQATCSMKLAAGAQVVTATYSGDANNASATGTLDLSVRKSGGCSYIGSGSTPPGFVLVLALLALVCVRSRMKREV